ncbi:RnfABCDGE type electron transport complex subunit D [candidate division NPL-UPA2 bacterium]|nr:RnfABCDGE type electron transport complex subunit D [candidate division NPL-UPA2 bacterium]
MKKEGFIITASPHIEDRMDVGSMMRGVVYGLIPAVAASVYFYRGKAISLIIVCILAALITEAIFQKVRRRKVTLLDGSALVTGILLALVLPPNLPLGIAILGAVIAIALGKQIFGGLGYNIFNPALVGRAFLMAAFPVLFTTWTEPFSLDAVTGATPLALMKFQGETTPLLDLFLGRTSGSLGETSAVALLLGGIYLLWKRYIDWRIPLGYLVTVFILGGAAHLINAAKFPSPLFHLLAGGLLLGALFMATDPVTTPLTKKGRWIFGLGSGILLIIIRLWGGLPEGVTYSILLMNMTTPLINKYTRPKPFGGRKIR